MLDISLILLDRFSDKISSRATCKRMCMCMCYCYYYNIEHSFIIYYDRE